MVSGSVKLHVQSFVAAFQFLTRLPLPMSVPFNSPVLTRSIIYFPAAGAFIGGCVAASAWLLNLVLPEWPAAVILLALWTALSGGLHLDGWMDTADGVLSHRSRERMLEIMKDSRVGAMGVLAAVLLLLLKASLLAELLVQENSAIYLMILIINPIWSRAWMAAAIGIWPSARRGEGIGQLFNGVNRIGIFAACFVSFILTFGILMSFQFKLTDIIAIMGACFFVTIVSGGLLGTWLNRKLGGLTGDTYGAMNEAVEAMLLLAAVVWLNAA